MNEANGSLHSKSRRELEPKCKRPVRLDSSASDLRSEATIHHPFYAMYYTSYRKYFKIICCRKRRMAQIIDACSHVYHAAFTATATLSNQGRMDRIIQFLDTFVMVKIKKNKHIALIKVYNLNKKQHHFEMVSPS